LYAYIGIQPIAFVHLAPDQAAEIYYIMTDYSHRPFIVANAAGAAIWASQADPFGVGAPNEDYDQDGINLTLNLRFPGQYFDAESGLHYNLNRYYDPTTGRYLESDPIGLKGGLNTYAYVGGNPVNFVDPLGLEMWLPGDSLPQEVVDFAVGFGDTISFGLTGLARDAAGIDGGFNPCSAAHNIGEWAGVGLGFTTGAAGAGRMAGWSVNFNKYKHGGGGLNVIKGSERKFGADLHKFKHNGQMVNRPHYHRGATKNQKKKHRPWQGGF
jgi:RHS repeat-associated protein